MTSPPHLVRMLVIGLFGVLSLYLAVAFGHSQRLSAERSALFAIGPTVDPWALGSRSFEIVQSQNKADFELARRLAHASLKIDPTVIPAIDTLAILDDLSGKHDRAKRLFNLSLNLSRRDLTTHLWFIEYFSSRGDANHTVRHYDAALRTSAAARAILFPILINAAFDPVLARPITDALVARPSWASEFVPRYVSSRGDTQALLSLLKSLKERGYPLDLADQNTALDRAINEGLFNEAFSLSGRKPSPAGLINAAFETDSHFQPFDWKLTSSSDFGSEVVVEALSSGKRARVLRLYSDTGTGGEVARQLMLLKPGTYTLQIKADSPISQDAAAFAIISCANAGGAELRRLELRGSGASNDLSQASFAIADLAKCPAQWLRLYVRPSKSVNTPSALVRSIFVIPVSSAATMSH